MMETPEHLPHPVQPSTQPSKDSTLRAVNLIVGVATGLSTPEAGRDLLIGAGHLLSMGENSLASFMNIAEDLIKAQQEDFLLGFASGMAYEMFGADETGLTHFIII